MAMNPSSEIIKRKSILSPLNDWLDQGYWQLRSTKVGALAGLLWLASLACPALINYGGDIYGYLVLLIGWITLSGFLVFGVCDVCTSGPADSRRRSAGYVSATHGRTGRARVARASDLQTRNSMYNARHRATNDHSSQWSG